MVFFINPRWIFFRKIRVTKKSLHFSWKNHRLKKRKFSKKNLSLGECSQKFSYLSLENFKLKEYFRTVSSNVMFTKLFYFWKETEHFQKKNSSNSHKFLHFFSRKIFETFQIRIFHHKLENSYTFSLHLIKHFFQKFFREILFESKTRFIRSTKFVTLRLWTNSVKSSLLEKNP